jgi:polysaccharide biosynthesis transport protein
VSQVTDRTDAANEVDIKHVRGALVPREQEMANYGAMTFPASANGWHEAAAAPGGVSLPRLAHSFRRRWLLALFCGLAFAIPAAVLTLLLFPSKYEVQALLQFQDVEGYLSTSGFVDPVRVQSYRNSQLQLADSTGVLTAVLRKPDIANLGIIKAENEKITFMQDSITVFTPKDSDLLIIRMKGEEPEDMVRIVKAVTQEYLDRAAADAKQDRANRVQVLRRHYEQNMSELSRVQNQYANLAKNAGGDTESARRKAELLRGEIQQLRADLSTDRKALATIEENIALLQARVEQIKRGDVSEPAVLAVIRKDPQMIEMTEEIDKLKRYLSNHESSFKDQNNPKIRGLRAELAQLEEKKQQLIAELRDMAIATMDSSAGELNRPEDKLAILTSRAQSMRSLIEKAETEFAARQEQLTSVDESSGELVAKEREIKSLEAAIADNRRRLEEAEVDLNLPPPVVLREPAEMPEGGTWWYRVLLSSFLGLVCFGLGVSGVTFLEYSKQRVSSINEIGYGGLGLRVLGTVPNLARIAHRSHNGNTNGAVAGILAESIDSVRTMLLQKKGADAPRVILVTSAGEHEGKTTVATHLAASLARAGKRTLMIDGDLRQPSVHKMFDMPLTPGLCEVLRGENEVARVVQPAEVEGMWLLMAGQCDHRAIAALAKQNAVDVFNQARADYDFVVVDTGPVLNFADTLLLGSHADAALLAILRDVSQIPMVYEARERLEAIGVPVLGGVVGGVTQRTARGYYAMQG